MLRPILDGVPARLAPLFAEADRLAAAAAQAGAAKDFETPLRAPGLAVIAEVKRRSPSVGPIAPELVPGDLAAEYVEGGAAAVSVLTEPGHFGGDLADLEEARRRIDAPLLRKDFIVHPVQVDESRVAGADAVLLIAAVLDDSDLAELVSRVTAGGMSALVEAHDADEVRRAVDAGAGVVGINNRDLNTFEVDLTTAEQLRPLVPEGVVAVAESGIDGPAGAGRMAAAGFDAILVGRAAAQAQDPAGFISSLRS